MRLEITYNGFFLPINVKAGVVSGKRFCFCSRYPFVCMITICCCAPSLSSLEFILHHIYYFIVKLLSLVCSFFHTLQDQYHCR
jgi:hypothetical protein